MEENSLLLPKGWRKVKIDNKKLYFNIHTECFSLSRPYDFADLKGTFGSDEINSKERFDELGGKITQSARK